MESRVHNEKTWKIVRYVQIHVKLYNNYDNKYSTV